MASLQALVEVVAKVTGAGAIDDLNKRLSVGTKLLKGFAAGFAVKEAAQYFKTVLDGADTLRDMSQKTGIGVQALSDLKAAAEDGGLSFEGLQQSLKKFSLNVAEASDGTGGASDAFRSLGISVSDATGKLKPSDQLLFEIADKFKGFEDGAKKSALASEFFGKKAGSDLVPLLNQGSDAIRGLGVAINDDFAGRADQFNDTLNGISRGLQSLTVRGLDALLPTLQEVLSVFNDLIRSQDAGVGFFEAIAEAIRLTVIIGNTLYQQLADTVDVLVSNGQQIIDFATTTAKSVTLALKGQFEEREKLQEDFIKRSDQRELEFLNRSVARQEKILSVYERLKKNSFVLGEGTVDEIRNRAREETKPTPLPKPQFEAPTLPNKDTAKKEASDIKAIEDRIAKIKADTEALGQNEAQKKRIMELAELDSKAIDKNSEAYKRLRTELLAALDAQQAMEQQLKSDPWRGARQSIEEYVAAASDVAAQTKGVFDKAFKGLEDAFVEFFTTGKASWKDFANTIIAEIVRIQIKRSIIAPLASGLGSIFGFADGGIMTGSGPVPLQKYANGGVANSPQLALFGEGSKPEAFVPLPDGRRIPVAMEGGQGGGGSTSVVVNVNMATGQNSSESDSADAGRLGKLIAAAVQSEIIKQQRNGGLLSAS